MIKQGGFDIVGHIDKIAMNAQLCSDFNPSEKWYVQLVEETLCLAKEKDMIVEINTKSFADKGFTFPHQRYFDFINDQKIPIIVNSDCHFPSNVVDSFRQVFGLLKKSGFKSMQQLTVNGWEEMEFDENGLIF